MNDRVEDLWGERTPFSPGESWPVRVERLRHPLVRENGRLVAVTWEKAMSTVLQGFYQSHQATAAASRSTTSI